MAPDFDTCAVQSPLGWFQGSEEILNSEFPLATGDVYDYLNHIEYCTTWVFMSIILLFPSFGYDLYLHRYDAFENILKRKIAVLSFLLLKIVVRKCCWHTMSLTYVSDKNLSDIEIAKGRKEGCPRVGWKNVVRKI